MSVSGQIDLREASASRMAVVSVSDPVCFSPELFPPAGDGSALLRTSLRTRALEDPAVVRPPTPNNPWIRQWSR